MRPIILSLLILVPGMLRADDMHIEVRPMGFFREANAFGAWLADRDCRWIYTHGDCTRADMENLLVIAHKTFVRRANRLYPDRIESKEWAKAAEQSYYDEIQTVTTKYGHR